MRGHGRLSLRKISLVSRPLSTSHRVFRSEVPVTARSSSDFKFLPPLPLPLQEADVHKNPYAQYGLYPSSTLLEQQAILQVLLAGGKLPRAKQLWQRMQRSFDRHKQSEEDYDGASSILASERELEATMKDVVPMQTHASFIRAFFRAALGLKDLQLEAQETTSAEGAKAAKDRQRQRRDFVKEAWDWWTMLLTRSSEFGVPDAQVVAAMLKGSIQIGKADSQLERPRQIVALVETLPRLGYDLSDILNETVFDSEAPAALGLLPPDDVLAHLSDLVRTSGSATLSKLLTSAKISQKTLEENGVARRSDPLEGVNKLDPTFHPGRGDQGAEASVPFKLETLRSHLASVTGHRSDHSDPYLRQKLLEESAYDAARQQYDHMQQMLKDNNVSSATAPTSVREYVWTWTQALAKRVSEHVDFDHKKPRIALDTFAANEQHFFAVLPPEQMAFTAVTVMLQLTSDEGPVHDGATSASACVMIGKAIEREYMAKTMSDLNPKGFEKQLKRTMEESQYGKGRDRALVKMWKDHQSKIEEEQEGVQSDVPKMTTTSFAVWTQSVRARVGAQLISWLLDAAKVTRTTTVTEVDEKGVLLDRVVTEEQPAFYHSYQYLQGSKLGVIRTNEHILAKMEHDPLDMTLYTRELPMVIPPRPWLDWDQGGYITHRTEVVRLHRDSAEQAAHIKAASASGQMTDIYAALDYLGQTPWRVNRKVYDIVSEVWNTGESIADIPPKDPLINIKDPEKPDNYDTNIEAHKSYRRLLQETAKERLNAHSSRCTINYQLEIARAFLGETLYFPHNLDFRGRAYPVPPNLSHIGNDLSRGLLTFAESKPLGAHGLYWLKVHLANTFGYDKYSFDERAAFADKHIEEILDSADKPLGGRRWWSKAEDPWQCLAACIEISGAIQSGDPENFLSNLPVQQDGTCNGLQHYAALGGDLAGAEAVNLINAERPGDVYGKVAQKVSKIVDRDAAHGVELAQLLQGKVTRKTVKQTVMTTVYGVTFIGAKKMIKKQLVAAESVPEAKIFEASIYLARRTFESIGDLFEGATALQKWLSHVARLVSGSVPEHRLNGSKKVSRMTTMAWTTPLGLPVVQPYRVSNRKQISTALQTIFLEDPNTPSQVDPRSQQSAMPPNYIHSLDATHMMMTALECKKDGIAFASVHDSFWSHAADVETLSRNLRKAFVDLHSQPLLDDLRNEVLKRYAGFHIPKSDLPNTTRAALGLSVRGSSKTKQKPTPASGRDEEEDAVIDWSEFEEALGYDGSPIPSGSVHLSSDDHQDLSEDDIAQLRPNVTEKVIQQAEIGHLIHLSDVLPTLPPRGPFDIKQVGESSYFFS